MKDGLTNRAVGNVWFIDSQIDKTMGSCYAQYDKDVYQRGIEL
jgi:hypothetical protein